MVATYTGDRFACCAFQKSNRVGVLLSLFLNRFRTVLAVQGSPAPRRNGVPWTAPGRSEELA